MLSLHTGTQLNIVPVILCMGRGTQASFVYCLCMRGMQKNMWHMPVVVCMGLWRSSALALPTAIAAAVAVAVR